MESGLRNVAYALLSGADGWMFDGEDALGQVQTMALDNQRNLKLAIAKDPVFLDVAEEVAQRDERWAQGFFGRPIIADWARQLDFTTKIFRCRGLHLDDRHVREDGGTGFSASIVDLVLYVVTNQERLRAAGSSVVLYLPKIQTAEEAALWNDMLTALETHLGLRWEPSRRTFWWSRSRRASSSWRSAPPSRRTSWGSTRGAGTTSTASPTRSPGTRSSSTPTSTPSS